MKKLFVSLLAIFILNVHGFSVVPSSIEGLTSVPETVVRPMRPAADQLRIAQMKFFIGLTPEKYETLKGKKLNFPGRMTFKITQRRMKKMLKQYESGDGPTTFDKINWLIKGLLLGPIALLLGYILFRDEERELLKWIWFGFAGFTIILVAILLTL